MPRPAESTCANAGSQLRALSEVLRTAIEERDVFRAVGVARDRPDGFQPTQRFEAGHFCPLAGLQHDELGQWERGIWHGAFVHDEKLVHTTGNPRLPASF